MMDNKDQPAAGDGELAPYWLYRTRGVRFQGVPTWEYNLPSEDGGTLPPPLGSIAAYFKDKVDKSSEVDVTE